MRKLKLICFLLIAGVLTAAAHRIPMEELESIKQAMVKAVESPRITDSLYTKLTGKKSDNALILAYIGTLEALKAKHSWNPYQKMKFVSMAQKTMARAVKLEPGNLQIRFMRFSIQHYTPQFLGYSDELDEDRKAIARHYKHNTFGETDELQVQNIAEFMIRSGRCTGEEVAFFKKYI